MLSVLSRTCLVFLFILIWSALCFAQSYGDRGVEHPGGKCSSCQGTGKVWQEAGRDVCKLCEGKGRLRTIKCMSCDGRGYFEHPARWVPCEECVHKGVIFEKEYVFSLENGREYADAKLLNSGGEKVHYVSVLLAVHEPQYNGTFRKIYLKLEWDGWTALEKSLTLPSPSSVVIPASQGKPNDFEYTLAEHENVVITAEFPDGQADDPNAFKEITALIRIKVM